MGDVYRATDTRLKRHVAIKVLPDALATDPERLARFQREAEVLASRGKQPSADTERRIVVVQDWDQELKRLMAQ